MNDIIPRSDDQPSAVAVSETQVGPKRSNDSPNLWVRCWNSVRTHIGLKPLHLVERIAEAQTRSKEVDVESKEIDNRLKLIKAKQEYELIQSYIRINEMKAAGELEKVQAEIDAIRGKVRSKKKQERIEKAAERELAKRGQSPDQAMEEMLKLISKVEAAGGAVEFVIPEEIPPEEDEPRRK